MSAPHTISPIIKLTPVKKLLTDKEKTFVSLISSIIVTKTISDAKKSN